MKTRHILFTALLLLSLSGYAQENSITSRTFTGAVQNPALATDENTITVTGYYDTAGRLRQTLRKGFAPDGSDLVDFTDYDGLGRKSAEFDPMPVGGNNGRFVGKDAFIQNYAWKRGYGYSLSALNRMISASGLHYGGSGVAYKHCLNWDEVPELSLFYLTADAAGTGRYRIGCSNAGTGKFFVSETRDEDGKRSLLFSDSDGRRVLERVIGNTGFMDTYFLYDALDRVIGVIPPEAAAELSSGSSYYSDGLTMNLFGYWYVYDHLNRKVGVKLPGAEWSYIVYDGESRPVLQQSGNLRKKGEWLFCKYDRLGRLVLQGVVKDARDRETIAAIWENRAVTESFSADGPCWGYSNDCKLGLGEYSITSACFYDTYDFTGVIGAEPPLAEAAENARGMQTGAFEVVLNERDYWRSSLFTYDDKGRLDETRRFDYFGGYNNRQKLYYNFQGLVTGEDNFYEGVRKVDFRYTYDHAGRRTATQYRYYSIRGAAPEFAPLSTMQYDSYGRPGSERTLHDSIAVNYNYYADGTLREIENPGRFSELLCKSSAVTTPYSLERCGNGNINDIRIEQLGKSYFWHYEYDLANRLTSGMMYDAEAFNRLSGEGERFNYDKMGNIKLLLRQHNGLDTDCLNMVYKGNQKLKITNVGEGNSDYDFPGYTDAADEETEVRYDANGNECANLDKGIVAVRYNILNLPDTIQFANGNQIINYYFANGEKSGSMSRTYTTPLSVPLDVVTNSNDPHIDVWELWNGKMKFKNGSPDYILFDGGYFSLMGNSGGSVLNPKIYAYIRDHLGSTRLVCDGKTGEVVQSLEYLPSGLVFRSRDFELQPYRFTGKELISMHGLDWYDSKARMQGSQIPDFKSLDPLCEKYYGISPYVYCGGNPVSRIDPTGEFFETAWDVMSLAVGVKSFTENVGQGNYKSAVVDGVGILTDALAAVIPGIPGGAGALIKAGRTADKAVDAAKAADKVNDTNKGARFGSKTDTYSNTDREAFRKAKDQNGIPKSQQPDKTTTVTEKGTGKNLKQHEFTNSKGEKIQIRKDNPRTYNDGGKQGKHYNAGNKGQKLKQHHKYGQ